MKNSVVKGALGALAVAGVAMVAGKAIQRKKVVKSIFGEYGIREKSPFGLADRIREMDDEQYQELKGKLIKEFASKCGHRKTEKEKASEA